MTKNKIEFIRGVVMCFIMVFGMNIFETTIHFGMLNLSVLLVSFNTFIFVFIMAYLVQYLVVGRMKNYVIKKYLSEEESKLAFILFNIIFIVTFMSMIMTVIGSIIGGESLFYILNNYFNIWPRNFCVAFFLNLLIASPFCNYFINKLENLKVKEI